MLGVFCFNWIYFIVIRDAKFISAKIIDRSQRMAKVNLSLCLTNETLRREGVWESGCINSHFLDLGTSWRWVVSFTPRLLYRLWKSPPYPLSEPPEPVWTTWIRENSWSYRDSDSDPSVVQPVASRYTDYATPAPWSQRMPIITKMSI
jgi:hypothetical protein